MRAGPALCLVVALLSGCGGGVSIGFGGDFWGDDVPPTVSLASSATSTTVRAGDTLRFVAAAADSDSGVDVVRFYRMDGIDITRIGSDASEPYEVVTTVPSDGRTTLTVYARAWDFAGNAADSVAVTLNVIP